MHDQTYILPLIPQLQDHMDDETIVVDLGEFTNFTPKKFFETLEMYLSESEVEKLRKKIAFHWIEGVIQCFDCFYRGAPGEIYGDITTHHLLPECPKCNSLSVDKVEGDTIRLQVTA